MSRRQFWEKTGKQTVTLCYYTLSTHCLSRPRSERVSTSALRFELADKSYPYVEYQLKIKDKRDEKLKLFHSKHCVGQVLQEVKVLVDMVVKDLDTRFKNPKSP